MIRDYTLRATPCTKEEAANNDGSHGEKNDLEDFFRFCTECVLIETDLKPTDTLCPSLTFFKWVQCGVAGLKPYKFTVTCVPGEPNRVLDSSEDGASFIVQQFANPLFGSRNYNLISGNGSIDTMHLMSFLRNGAEREGFLRFIADTDMRDRADTAVYIRWCRRTIMMRNLDSLFALMNEAVRKSGKATPKRGREDDETGALPAFDQSPKRTCSALPSE